MFRISYSFTHEFNEIINLLLNEVVQCFMEIGEPLSFEEIYAVAFPLHMRDSEENILSHLHRIQISIQDKYLHNLTSLDEYILYGVLEFMYEATKDDSPFTLDDLVEVAKKNYPKLREDDLIDLSYIRDISNLIGICFDDVDFDDVGMFFEWYKTNPELLEKFAHVDLDYYTDIMPLDILKEYEEIKASRKACSSPQIPTTSLKLINDIENFKLVVTDTVNNFKHAVFYSKGYMFLHNETDGTADEKKVQRLFKLITKREFELYNILLSPEVDTGRGAVDFYASIGTRFRALIELKLSKSNNKKNGLLFQLPTYMEAEKVDFGIYVLICYDEKSYEESKQYYDLAVQLSEQYNKDIRFINIYAPAGLPTASNVRTVKDILL